MYIFSTQPILPYVLGATNCTPVNAYDPLRQFAITPSRIKCRLQTCAYASAFRTANAACTLHRTAHTIVLFMIIVYYLVIVYCLSFIIYDDLFLIYYVILISYND